jgi:hypothetical protein
MLVPRTKQQGRNEMWRVVAILQGSNGELTEMRWLSTGDRFEAIHSAMSAISQPDDVPWVKIRAINIEKIED